MKSDIFDFNRFGRYLMTDLKSFFSNYWISLVILSLSGVIIYIFSYLLKLTIGFGKVPGEFSRMAIFAVFALVTAITAPKKCYGYITNKNAGTSFLMLPVSKLEKYVSMLIICCIIIPSIFTIIYLSIDSTLCFFDKNCGTPIISINIWEAIGQHNRNMINMDDGTRFDISNLGTVRPWTFIDDYIGIVLFFLLGALSFKRSKIAKTIGSYFILSTIIGFIIILFFIKDIQEFIMIGTNEHLMETVHKLDLISDTIINLGLITAIWFRLKTVKH